MVNIYDPSEREQIIMSVFMDTISEILNLSANANVDNAVAKCQAIHQTCLNLATPQTNLTH